MSTWVVSPTTSGRPVAKVGSLRAEEPLLIKGPLFYQKGLYFFEPQVCQKVNYYKKSTILLKEKSTILYKRTTQLKFLATGLSAMINVIVLLCIM